MACIAIDCRFAPLPVGIGTYTRELVPRLIEKLQGHHIVVFVRKEDDWTASLPSHINIVKISANHYSLAEQFEIPKRLKQLSVDLFFCPHFNVPLRVPCSFVCTIHDLILHHYPNSASFAKRLAYKRLMKHAVNNARHCIAVSAHTASDIRSVYGEPAGLTVVTEGVDELFAPPSASSERENAFLYVGGAKQHKNVQMLIDAHATVDDGSTLIVVTGGKESENLRVSDRVQILKNLEPTKLKELYSKAKCFVTASEYEGFCLPILEARACGCPVIAVDRSATPEVAGSHAVLTQPTTEALAEAMRNSPMEADPVEAKYNWDSAADQTAAILLSSL